MRKIGFIALALVIAVIAIGAVVPNFIKLNNYKPLITEQVKKATGYTLVIDGDIQLTLLPSIGAKLHDVKLAKGTEGILVAKEVSASVSVGDLLAKKVTVETASLVSPQIHLVHGVDGKPVYLPDTPAAKIEEGAAATTTEPVTQLKAENSFTLKSFKISDGELTYINKQQSSEQKLSGINATLAASGLQGPADIVGSLIYNGQKLDIKAQAEKLDKEKQALPLKADIRYGDSLAGQFDGLVVLQPALRFEGRLDAATEKIAALVNVPNASADIQTVLNERLLAKTDIIYSENAATLKNLDLTLGRNKYTGEAAFALGSPLKLSVKLDPVGTDGTKAEAQKNLQGLLRDLSVDIQAEGSAGKMSVQRGAVRLAGYTINVSGGLDSVSEKPTSVLSLNLRTAKVNLDDLQQYGLMTGGGKAGALKAPDDAKDKTAAAQKKEAVMKLKFQADVGELVYQGASYSNIKAAGVLHGQSLTLNDMQVTALNGATVSASGRIQNMKALTGIDMAVKASTPDADATLKSLNIAKPENFKKALGVANVDVKVRGDVSSLATNATVNALQFNVGVEGTVKNPTTKLEAENLSFSVRHPNLQQAIQTFQPQTTLPEGLAGALNIKGRVNLGDKKYIVSDIAGTIGSATVAGNIIADVSGAKPDVKAQLQLGRLAIAADKYKTETFARGFEAPTQADVLTYVATGGGKWSREALNLGWLNAFNLDLQMNIQDLQYQLWRLNNVVLATTVNNGTLNIKDMQAGLFGGKLVISGNVSQPEGGAAVSISNKVSIQNVEARDLFSALTAKPQRFISGTIDDFNLDIAGQGVSQAALMQSLKGSGVIDGKGITIYGLNVRALTKLATGDGKPVEALGNFLGRTITNGQTNFKTMKGNFPIQNGVVNVNGFTMDGDEAVLETAGTVDLAAWLMDLKNKVSLKQATADAPSFDIALKGPIDQPVQSLGQQALQGYINKKLGSKLESFLGDKLGLPKAAAPAPASAPTPVAPSPVDGAVAPQPVEPAPAEPQLSPEEQLRQEAVKGLMDLLGN